jgi:hypothetical protein
MLILLLGGLFSGEEVRVAGNFAPVVGHNLEVHQIEEGELNQQKRYHHVDHILEVDVSDILFVAYLFLFDCKFLVVPSQVLEGLA